MKGKIKKEGGSPSTADQAQEGNLLKTLDVLWASLNMRKSKKSSPSTESGLSDVRIAACALFLEMARADGEFSDEEQGRILTILKNDYHLSDEEALVLIQSADRELEQSIDLWHFTNRINQSHSEEEKIDIISMLWKIVYADGTLDKHERYLVHKLSNLLRLSHQELIDAKMRVLKEGKASAG